MVWVTNYMAIIIMKLSSGGGDCISQWTFPIVRASLSLNNDSQSKFLSEKIAEFSLNQHKPKGTIKVPRILLDLKITRF